MKYDRRNKTKQKKIKPKPKQNQKKIDNVVVLQQDLIILDGH